MAPNDRAPVHDDRWGDHIPWSLRYSTFSQKGDFDKFMTNLATRLHTLIEHNEADIPNKSHFFARLKSESLGRFRPEFGQSFAENMRCYFDPEIISREAAIRTNENPEAKESKSLYDIGNRFSKEPKRYATHRRNLIAERLEVLNSILFLLGQDKKDGVLKDLVRDVRRFAAASGVLLNVNGDPPTLLPLEEPLLQKEVLNRLLPRLQENFPDRASDLIRAYHDVLKGVDTNTVFGNAFKALEQLARDISGNPKLELTKEPELRGHFPKLHRTILVTITKLAAQRGDEGGHARLGPDEYEIRYLLFSICNVALLLLEYKEHCG